MNTVKIALGQLLVEGGVPKRNLLRAQKLLEKATTQGVDLIVLPETLDFGWTHPLALKRAEPIPGKYSEFFQALAKKLSISICVGLTEATPQGNFNTALLISPQGELLLKYRKIHLIPVEIPYYQKGEELGRVDLPWGKVGLNICSDNYMEGLHIAESLKTQGAELLLSPCAWTMEHQAVESDNPYADKWQRPFQIISQKMQLSVFAATSVGYIVGGPYEGMKMMGGSLAYHRDGRIEQAQINEFTSDLLISEWQRPESDGAEKNFHSPLISTPSEAKT